MSVQLTEFDHLCAVVTRSQNECAKQSSSQLCQKTPKKRNGEDGVTKQPWQRLFHQAVWL